MTRFVIDASVALRWIVDLPHSAEARAFVSFEHRLLAPDFIHAEVGNALNTLVARKLLPAAEAPLAYEDFCRAPLRLFPTQPCARQALHLAQLHGRSFYDALYLAVAMEQEAILITADRKFWNGMKGTNVAGFIRCLGEGRPSPSA